MKSLLIGTSNSCRTILLGTILLLLTSSTFAISVKFSVDMAYQIKNGTFNPVTDKVFVRGSFNGWGEWDQMNKQEGTSIYTCSRYLDALTKYEYKYYITSAGATNYGWESNIGEGDNGDRVIETDLVSFDNRMEYYNNNVVSSNPVIILPNGGEKWKENSIRKIFWSAGPSSKIKLEYSINEGVNWNLIAQNLNAVDGKYEWTLPESVSENCLIKISDQNNSSSFDLSDQPFTIIEQDIPGRTYVKFTVDMSYQISDGTFNASTDKLYIRGSFNNNDLSAPMVMNADGTYSVTLNMVSNTWFSFKFYTNSKTMPNSGWETKPGIWNEERAMTIGSNRLDLAKVYFNNANMKLQSTSPFFNIYADDVDLEYIDTLTSFMNDNCVRITNALEVSSCQKVNLWFFPTQRTYFFYKGYPDSPAWSGGGAIGQDNVITFSPRYFANLDDCLGTANHEFTHSTVACKMTTPVSVWLNEGTAMFFAGDGLIRPIDNIRYIVNNLKGGVKPSLKYIETDAFAEGNGYPLSQSVSDFIFTVHGTHKLAEFIGNFDYSVLGYTSKEDFQDHWQQYLDEYYLEPQANVKIYVDMSYYISKGLFDPAKDKVLIGGDFSHWYTFQMFPQGNGIYSFVTTSPYNQNIQYKFKINSAGAASEGWEENVGTGTDGSRLLNIGTTEVTTKAYLFNNQNPTISIVSPNGGGLFIAGDSATISWKYTTISTLKIEYSTDNGSSWSLISNSVQGDKMSMRWKVPSAVSSSVKIRISDASNNTVNDVSDSSFSIVEPDFLGGPYLVDEHTIALIHFENNLENIASPEHPAYANNNPGFVPSVNLSLASSALIDNTSISKNVEIPHYNELSLTNDFTIEMWFYIRSWGSGSVEYPTLLTKPGSNYYIYLDATSKTLCAGFDYNGGTERVCLPSNSLQPGKWFHVALSKNNSNSTLKCALHNSDFQFVASESITYNKSHVPKKSSEPVFVGGSSGGSNCQFDGYVDELRISNIAREYRSLVITAPDGGEKLISGNKTNITWTSSDISKVKLEYSTNNGSSWTVIANNVDATLKSYSWTLPNAASSTCKIRISDQGDASFLDVSDQVFTIGKAAFISLTKPNGGESWTTGSIQTITWNSESVSTVKLEYSTNGGTTWNSIAEGVTASSGSYSWSVPDAVSITCKIKISNSSDALVFDVSDQSFSIVNAPQTNIPVTFSVDMNYQIKNGIFNPATDKLFLKGSFNGWSEQNPMSLESNGVYTCTLVLEPFTSYQYKYFINSAGAENGGWEMSISDGENGNRVLKTGTSSIVLPKDYFNNRRVSIKELQERFEIRNCPNPFNGSTDFLFTVSSGVNVSITVFDILGKEIANVVNENFQPGSYVRKWDAPGLKGGIYFYRMRAGEFTATQRLVVVR